MSIETLHHHIRYHLIRESKMALLVEVKAGEHKGSFYIPHTEGTLLDYKKDPVKSGYWSEFSYVQARPVRYLSNTLKGSNTELGDPITLGAYDLALLVQILD